MICRAPEEDGQTDGGERKSKSFLAPHLPNKSTDGHVTSLVRNFSPSVRRVGTFFVKIMELSLMYLLGCSMR